METNNKLREALVSVKKSIDDMGAASLNGDSEVLLVSLTQVCARLSARIEAALAEPVKNCEVGTAKEQSARFFALCDSNKCSSCPCRFTKKTDCALIWAQLPYEEGGAK